MKKRIVASTAESKQRNSFVLSHRCINCRKDANWFNSSDDHPCCYRGAPGGGGCPLPNENCGNSLAPLPVALATVVQNDIFESFFHRKSNSLKIFTVGRETAFQKKL